MYLESSLSELLGSPAGVSDGDEYADAMTSRNNSMPGFAGPKKPKAYVPVGLSDPAIEFRKALRPKDETLVELWFRVRRMNYEKVLWQLFSSNCLRRDQIYQPNSLPYWTIGMRVKVCSRLSLGRVMTAIRCRLGINQSELRFCLDGFFGMRGYSDIFGNLNTCAWMEITYFSTVCSLRLKDGDSVFISVASQAEIANAINFRRETAMRPLQKPPKAGSDTVALKL